MPLTLLTSVMLPIYTAAEYVIRNKELWTVVTAFLVAFGIPLITLKRRISRGSKVMSFFTLVQVRLQLLPTKLDDFRGIENFIL